MISRRAILSAPLPLCLAAPAMAQLIPSPVSAPIGKLDGLFAPGVAFDFSTPGTLPAGATFSRASQAWHFEGANAIRNPTMLGTVNGSPGTVPTNWTLTTASGNGVTRTIVGTGTEDGIPFIDIRYAGTPTASTNFYIVPDLTTVVPALQGQTWSAAVFCRLMAGSLANLTLQHSLTERSNAGASLGASSITFVPTSAPLSTQRIEVTRTFTQATTAFTVNQVQQSTTINLPVDFTIRYGLPSLTTASVPFVPQLANDNVGAPRWPYDPATAALRGLFNEAAATNGIRNASALGSVAGTPGTPPTNWSVTGPANGITRTIVGTGTEDGIQYIDVQYAGTPSASSSVVILPEGTAIVAALTGQTWTASLFVRLTAGTLTNAALRIETAERDNAGALLSQSLLAITPTGAALKTQRSDLSRTFGDAAAAFATNSLRVSYTSALPIDLTLRIGLPQLVQAAAPTSPIVTTTVAVTRAADVLTLPVANGTYSVDVTTDVGTTTLLNQIVSGGAYVVPNGPAPLRSVSFR
jgi:hypothetical protein